MFEQIRTTIESRVTTWKLAQIKLGVALAIRDYPTGAVNYGALPSRTAHNAYNAYTIRRYRREEEARKVARRREAALSRRRGYTTV